MKCKLFQSLKTGKRRTKMAQFNVEDLVTEYYTSLIEEYTKEGLKKRFNPSRSKPLCIPINGNRRRYSNGDNMEKHLEAMPIYMRSNESLIKTITTSDNWRSYSNSFFKMCLRIKANNYKASSKQRHWIEREYERVEGIYK